MSHDSWHPRRAPLCAATLAVWGLLLLLGVTGCRGEDDPPSSSQGGDAQGQAPGLAPGQAQGQAPGLAPGQAQGLAPGLAPGQAPGQVPAEAAAQDSAEARDEAFDQLRSLGYVDYSEDEADESLSGVVRFDRERSHPGYNLYSHAGLGTALLIDQDGRVVHSWEHGLGDAYCELLPNGDLLLPGTDRDEADGRNEHYNCHLLRLSWDGDVV